MDTDRQPPSRQRVAVISLGCKLNQAEGEAMRHLCGESQFDLVPFEAEADVYVVNTCTVTSEADREGRRLARQARRRGPRNAKIILAGCSAQANPEGMRIPEADLLLGNTEKLHLPEHLARPVHRNGGGSLLPEVRVAPFDERPEFENFSFPRFEGRTRAYLKVQDGCDFSCSFCATTLARGASRSLEPGACVEQARRLVAGGHREIVLTGIHLGAYGRDLKPRHTLSRLLGQILEVEGLRRVRLSSVEPGEVTRELIRVAARSAYGKAASYACRHFHVPVQSGDDAVLKAMERNYTADRCARRFDELARLIPGVCLGADFIAGFPGESPAAFERTLDWVREAPIAYLHVFSYSPRKGTPAADLRGRLHGDEMRRRVRALRDLGARKWAAFVAAGAGGESEVLIERRREDGFLAGLTDNYVRVGVDGPDNWIGEIVPVRLEPKAANGSGALNGTRSDELIGIPLA
ncbi:MAG: tRNA (N(6)-L-threonylcarbamoyladenosine(37)-C(2))-methylthiotransferase MtaB [bacterium]